MDLLSKDIRDGIRHPGAQLPSLRLSAVNYGVSKSTAVEIYERLVALELIEARGNSGFFVRDRRSGLAEPVGLNWELDALPDQRNKQGRRPIMKHHPSGGWLGKHVLPIEALRFALREASRSHTADLLEYPATLGYTPLRKLLAERLGRLGVSATENSILLTDSASMSIDMICRVMLSPGDTVLVDDPTSIDYSALSRLYSVSVIGIPFKDRQRDMDFLREAILRHKPKLYILSPVLQNPTGRILRGNEAFELLSIAKEAGIFLVEDDVFSDIVDGPATHLSALADQRGVAYVNSFSKTVSAGLRCGFICAEPSVISRLAIHSVETAFGLNSLTAIVVYKLLQSGLYRRNVSTMRKVILSEREDVSTKLLELGFEIPEAPEGGVFIWARWPGSATAQNISDIAVRHGVYIAPGPTFSPSNGYEQYIRFNCTLMASPSLWAALKAVVAESEVFCQ